VRQLARIKAGYDWLVQMHETALAAAEATGDQAAVTRLENVRDVMDRGIFVLLFGQFEQHVTEIFEAARDRRAGNLDWRTRRGWDTPALSGRRLPFETRLALVLDRRTPVYRAVIHAYALRNHLAHGGTAEPVGSIEQLVVDLYAWQAALER
jgi:hypothetical protein